MDQYQLVMLVTLLNNNASLIDSFAILNKMYPNNKRIKQIINQLEAGKGISTILVKDKREKRIGYYSNFTNLAKAISVVIDLENNKKGIITDLLGKLAYPFVLFIASMLLLFIFSDNVLPSMLINFEIQSDGLVIQFKLIKYFSLFIIVLLIGFILFIGYFLIMNKMSYLWLYLHDKGIDGLFKVIASYNFANELKVLLYQGIVLDKSIDMIRLYSTSSFAKMLASKLRNRLINGDTFKQCLSDELFDSKFASICLIEMQNNNFLTGVENYCQLIEVQIKQLLNKLAILIQVICYLLVSLIIILSYKVLLIPLEILKNF